MMKVALLIVGAVCLMSGSVALPMNSLRTPVFAHLPAVPGPGRYFSRRPIRSTFLKASSHDSSQRVDIDTMRDYYKTFDERQVNDQDEFGRTALHQAVQKKRIPFGTINQIVGILIESGVDVNHRDAKGNTALHLVAKSGNTGAVDLLLAAGASLEEKNDAGETPLIIAAAAKKHLMTEHLLELDAQVDAVNNNGETALHRAVIAANGLYELSEPELFSEVATVHVLLHYGAKVRTRNLDGATPLKDCMFDDAIKEMLIEAVNEREEPYSDGDKVNEELWMRMKLIAIEKSIFGSPE